MSWLTIVEFFATLFVHFYEKQMLKNIMQYESFWPLHAEFYCEQSWRWSSGFILPNKEEEFSDLKRSAWFRNRMLILKRTKKLTIAKKMIAQKRDKSWNFALLFSTWDIFYVLRFPIDCSTDQVERIRFKKLKKYPSVMALISFDTRSKRKK